jgi:hypothetical protein
VIHCPHRVMNLDDALADLERAPSVLVRAVFRRYGRPLAVALSPIGPGDRWVALEDGAQVRIARVMGFGDVIPNDWFVLEGAGEPVAVAGPLFASALRALLGSPAPD